MLPQQAQGEPATLRAALTAATGVGDRRLWGVNAGAALADLTCGTSIAAPLEELRGQSVLLRTREQLPTALALIELDGVARRIVLCTPDVSDETVTAIIATAEIDVVVGDFDTPSGAGFVPLRQTIAGPAVARGASEHTEWVLLTSGTTGMPKLVSHTFASLTRPMIGQPVSGAVWSTFYDMRRYGGLQIFLRAMLGGGSMVLSSASEPVGDFVARLGHYRATHVSGTPSHWRRALMSNAGSRMTSHYVRLSGEIADQTVLDRLRASYPHAEIAHAFASTEAGVAFDVRDGLAGFPETYLGRRGGVEIRVCDGSLRIRSGCTAHRYLGGIPFPCDEEGYVDTGDIVELHNGRYYFVGRRGGVVNIGGLKVYPEEIEAVINRHPAVHMSLVKSRKNPITGSLVVADVVLKRGTPADPEALRREILDECRSSLARHKVPTAIQFVSGLDVAASGKLLRADA